MICQIGYYVILAIIICGIVGIAIIILRQTGVAIPSFIVSILWILLAVVLGIIAVRFLLTLAI